MIWSSQDYPESEDVPAPEVERHQNDDFFLRKFDVEDTVDPKSIIKRK